MVVRSVTVPAAGVVPPMTEALMGVLVTVAPFKVRVSSTSASETTDPAATKSEAVRVLETIASVTELGGRLTEVLAVKVVKVPGAGVVPPITELSTVPPLIVRLLSTSASETTDPAATRSEAVRVSETIASVTELGGRLTDVLMVRAVNVPAAGVVPPMTEGLILIFFKLAPL